MGVYIKGMDMPKKPGAYSMKIRLFVREDGTGAIWGLEEYLPHEPLDVIPVPPHGRLIDADALMQQIEHDTPLSSVFEKTMRRYLHNAPTVIPAESEGET